MKSFCESLDAPKGKHVDSMSIMSLFCPGTKFEGIAASHKDTTLVNNLSITYPKHLQSHKGLSATIRYKECGTSRTTISFGHIM